MDPEDFDSEDLDDEMFKNLKVDEIEELFNGSPSKASLKDSDEKVDGRIKDLLGNSDSDALLENQEGGDLINDDDLEFMDFEEQLKIYDSM